MGKTLESKFERKLNSLNAIRLLLATGVIFWHSYALTGRQEGWAPARQLLGEVWVDGFFALSGFLILGSWLNRPSPRRYLVARVRRIAPAFYACLIVTAGILAPAVALVQGMAPFSPESLSYLLKNAGLWIFQHDIAGTPADVPDPGVWNGSLWTLAWEFFCYLGVLVLGLLRLFRFKATVPAVFAICWIASLAAELSAVESENFAHAARFGLMFASGMLVQQLTHKLRVSRLLVLVAFGVVSAAMFLPDYRLIGAPFLAYALVGLGALIKSRSLVLANDISYGMYIYAFPVQQVLVLAGLAILPIPVFGLIATVATVPLAAASWYFVERPFLRGAQSKKSAADASTPSKMRPEATVVEESGKGASADAQSGILFPQSK